MKMRVYQALFLTFSFLFDSFPFFSHSIYAWIPYHMHETHNNFIIYGSQYDKSNKNASVMVALYFCNKVQ